MRHLVVAVSKMDARDVQWQQARFEEIQNEINVYFRRAAILFDSVSFVPVSGWLGDNLVGPVLYII